MNEYLSVKNFIRATKMNQRVRFQTSEDTTGWHTTIFKNMGQGIPVGFIMIGHEMTHIHPFVTIIPIFTMIA